MGVRKICDFQLRSPFISETVQDRPMVWNVNRKSYAADRCVSGPMKLSDPYSVFQGHKSNISKRCILETKSL